MNKTLFFVLVLTGVLPFLLTPVSVAEEMQKPQKVGESRGAVPEDQGVIQEASGKISSIDPQAKTVVLKKGLLGKSAEFKVDLSTAITEGGDRLNLTDLEVGDKVRIDYYTLGGKNIARFIEIQTKGKDSAG